MAFLFKMSESTNSCNPMLHIGYQLGWRIAAAAAAVLGTV